jgi:hypothetical protein
MCLKIDRTSDGFDTKPFGLEHMKRSSGISNGSRQIRNWTVWRGWPTSEVEEKPTNSISARRARKMGAPATREFFPTTRKKGEKNKEKIWMMVIT